MLAGTADVLLWRGTPNLLLLLLPMPLLLLPRRGGCHGLYVSRLWLRNAHTYRSRERLLIWIAMLKLVLVWRGRPR
jgi:hypothetical protein